LSLPEFKLNTPSVGDIAKAPHPSNRSTIQPLRLRVALEDATISEMQFVEARGGRIGVQCSHLVEELGRVLKQALTCDKRSSSSTPFTNSQSIRHISINLLLQLMTLPSIETTRMPSAVESSVAFSSETVFCSWCSACRRA
jgi:hypothetical protein